MDGQQVKNSNIAFEDGFDGSPPELWRLEAKRTTPFGTKEITHVRVDQKRHAGVVHL